MRRLTEDFDLLDTFKKIATLNRRYIPALDLIQRLPLQEKKHVVYKLLLLTTPEDALDLQHYSELLPVMNDILANRGHRLPPPLTKFFELAVFSTALDVIVRPDIKPPLLDKRINQRIRNARNRQWQAQREILLTHAHNQYLRDKETALTK